VPEEVIMTFRVRYRVAIMMARRLAQFSLDVWDLSNWFRFEFHLTSQPNTPS